MEINHSVGKCSIILSIIYGIFFPIEKYDEGFHLFKVCLKIAFLEATILYEFVSPSLTNSVLHLLTPSCRCNLFYASVCLSVSVSVSVSLFLSLSLSLFLSPSLSLPQRHYGPIVLRAFCLQLFWQGIKKYK